MSRARISSATVVSGENRNSSNHKRSLIHRSGPRTFGLCLKRAGEEDAKYVNSDLFQATTKTFFFFFDRSPLSAEETDMDLVSES